MTEQSVRSCLCAASAGIGGLIRAPNNRRQRAGEIGLATDFTLVIPTYNRQGLVRNLLRYLESQQFHYPVLVLDSSRDEVKEENRRFAQTLSISVVIQTYDSSTKPFDKFRDGIARVTTPFCGLCADDDLILCSTLEPCLEFLRANEDYGAAAGYGAKFQEVPHRDRSQPPTWHLSEHVFYNVSLDSPDPLARLSTLLSDYQALTYSYYRTPVLLKTFDLSLQFPSILTRELLSGAITVLLGKFKRFPMLTHLRNMLESVSTRNWHPTEWLINDPQEMFTEYMGARDVLLSVLPDDVAIPRTVAESRRIIDWIFLVYMCRHLPPSLQNHVVFMQLGGFEPNAIWTDDIVRRSLLTEARRISGSGEAVRSLDLQSRARPTAKPEIVGDAAKWRAAEKLAAASPALIKDFVLRSSPYDEICLIALSLAAGDGDTTVVRSLLSLDVPADGFDGEPVSLAACNGHVDVVKLLLEYGANPLRRPGEALVLSAAADHGEIFQLLLRHSPPPMQHVFAAGIQAAGRGHNRIISIVNAYANGRQAHAAFVHEMGPDALRGAASSGHAETLKLLAAMGCPIHALAQELLSIAVTNGAMEATTTLLQFGFDPLSGGMEILDLAIEGGDPNMLGLLQAFGVPGAVIRERGRSKLPQGGGSDQTVVTPCRTYWVRAMFLHPEPRHLFGEWKLELPQLLKELDGVPSE